MVQTGIRDGIVVEIPKDYHAKILPYNDSGRVLFDTRKMVPVGIEDNYEEYAFTNLSAFTYRVNVYTNQSEADFVQYEFTLEEGKDIKPSLIIKKEKVEAIIKNAYSAIEEMLKIMGIPELHKYRGEKSNYTNLPEIEIALYKNFTVRIVCNAQTGEIVFDTFRRLPKELDGDQERYFIPIPEGIYMDIELYKGQEVFRVWFYVSDRKEINRDSFMVLKRPAELQKKSDHAWQKYERII